MWAALTIALLGTYLNARRCRISFLIWILSNMLFGYNAALVQQNLPLTLFFLAGMAFCWYGWVRWNSNLARDYDAATSDDVFDDMTDEEFEDFLQYIQGRKHGQIQR